MDNALSSVLKKRREELGLTLLQIADRMDVSESTVQRWESGNIKSMRRGKIDKLAEILGVNPAALMGWETEQHLPSNVTPIDINDYYKAPRVGTIACGTPILAEQNIEQYDLVPNWIHCDFTLKCQGDSMTGARIYDGDIVCIRQQPEVENGEIAAVLIGEEATLKRVFRYGDTLVLRPENPQYEEHAYSGDDLSQVRILGKATHFISAIR